MIDGTLFDRLMRTVRASVGSAERMHIAELLDVALRVEIEPTLFETMRAGFMGDPSAFVRVLDLVEWPTGPIWFEWPFETVSGHGGGTDALTGVLIAPHPIDDGVYFVVTGWFDGQVADHSLGVAILRSSVLSDLAREAADGTVDHVLDALMDRVSASVPYGLAEEIVQMASGEVMADPILRDATGEIPMTLGALLAASATGILAETVGEGRIRISSAGRTTGPLGRLTEALRPSPPKGFSRDRGRLHWQA